MSLRIRCCVECPNCHTRYLLGFSPYSNGAYLVSSGAGSLEEFALYCSCGRPPTLSRWNPAELKQYKVLTMAHHRGFGASDEIVPVAFGEATSPKSPMLQQNAPRRSLGLARR
jgi:hypothetical protein